MLSMPMPSRTGLRLGVHAAVGSERPRKQGPPQALTSKLPTLAFFRGATLLCFNLRLNPKP